MARVRKILFPKFDTYKPIMPGAWHEVVLRVNRGPGRASINDCVCAPSYAECVRRAVVFTLSIPVQGNKENLPWPQWPRALGRHVDIAVPLALVQQFRCEDDTLDFIGRVVLLHGYSVPVTTTPTTVMHVRGYDASNRSGGARVFSLDYHRFLELLLSGAFPLADRSH